MVLTHSQAQAFYDRFGKRQDSQAFFEDAALDELISHGAFEPRAFSSSAAVRAASRLVG
jgi:hypothetical protein